MSNPPPSQEDETGEGAPDGADAYVVGAAVRENLQQDVLNKNQENVKASRANFFKSEKPAVHVGYAQM